MNNGDLPIGFVMALAENEAAMKKFSALNENQKEAVLNKTRKINSKNEMQCFVNYLSEDSLKL